MGANTIVAMYHSAGSSALVHELAGANYSVVKLVEQEDAGRLAAARLVASTLDDVGIVVDLFCLSSGIEPEVVAQASVIDVWPGLLGRVARAGHLIALKLLSRARRRPQDHVELVNLLLVADAEERALAYEAARDVLIEELEL